MSKQRRIIVSAVLAIFTCVGLTLHWLLVRMAGDLQWIEDSAATTKVFVCGPGVRSHWLLDLLRWVGLVDLDF